MKKKFKEQLAEIDEIIDIINKKNSINLGVTYRTVGSSLSELKAKRTAIIEKQLAKREKQVKKLERMLGFKRISDLQMSQHPDPDSIIKIETSSKKDKKKSAKFMLTPREEIVIDISKLSDPTSITLGNGISSVIIKAFE